MLLTLPIYVHPILFVSIVARYTCSFTSDPIYQSLLLWFICLSCVVFVICSSLDLFDFPFLSVTQPVQISCDLRPTIRGKQVLYVAFVYVCPSVRRPLCVCVCLSVSCWFHWWKESATHDFSTCLHVGSVLRACCLTRYTYASGYSLEEWSSFNRSGQVVLQHTDGKLSRWREVPPPTGKLCDTGGYYFVAREKRGEVKRSNTTRL